MSAHPPAISVIMPVYNSRDYVAEAVDGVLAQDFRDFELLLVDDGSTDGSANVCDGIAAQDERVCVLHIPNGGMCHARNLALDQARGTYVTFVDNDDECLPGFLGNNYALATISNADVVRFGRRTETYLFDDASPEVTEYVPKEEQVFRGNEVYAHMRELHYGSNGVWTGLYRRALLNRWHVRFNEELRHGCEDKIFNLDVYDHAEVVCLNPHVYYVWRRRTSHSMSLSFDDNYFLGVGLYIHRQHQFYAEHGIYELDPAFCASERLLNFRGMVGDHARAGDATFAQDIEFCARVRAVFDRYWDTSLVDPRVPQSLALAWIMEGRYARAAFVVRAWRAKVRGGMGKGGTQ